MERFKQREKKLSLRQEQVEQDDLDNADNEYNDDIVDIDNEE